MEVVRTLEQANCRWQHHGCALRMRILLHTVWATRKGLGQTEGITERIEARKAL